MGYTLNAFIGKAASLKQQALRIPDAQLVKLPQDFAMIPIQERYPQVQGVVIVEPFYTLSKTLCSIGSAVSAAGPLGFIEIELFAGQGERAAILWHNQEVVFGPVFSEESSAVTNQLLSLLGVQKMDKHDEFDALELGKYRSTSDWLKNTQ